MFLCHGRNQSASSQKAYCGDGKGTGKGYRNDQMCGTAFVKRATE